MLHKTINIEFLRITALIEQVKDLVKANVLTNATSISLISNLVDVDKEVVETELEEYIFTTIDKIEVDKYE